MIGAVAPVIVTSILPVSAPLQKTFTCVSVMLKSQPAQFIVKIQVVSQSFASVTVTV